MASVLPLRYVVTMVLYGLPDLRPRCSMVAVPGRKRAIGLSAGLRYLTWMFSNQAGYTIGMPGALFGWSFVDMASSLLERGCGRLTGTVPAEYQLELLWDNGGNEYPFSTRARPH